MCTIFWSPMINFGVFFLDFVISFSCVCVCVNVFAHNFAVAIISIAESNRNFIVACEKRKKRKEEGTKFSQSRNKNAFDFVECVHVCVCLWVLLSYLLYICKMIKISFVFVKNAVKWIHANPLLRVQTSIGMAYP